LPILTAFREQGRQRIADSGVNVRQAGESFCGGKVPVGKGQELLPVIVGECVATFAVVIANGVANGGIDRRHIFNAEAFFAKQLIDRFGVSGREERAIAIGVAPIIFRGGGRLYIYFPPVRRANPVLRCLRFGVF
jgi:hypothetical protein